MRKVCLVSLGCPKNLVDSERILGALTSQGWAVTPDARAADLIILNTCAFLSSAVEEAEAEIARLDAAKRDGTPLLVVGCYPQRAGRRLAGRREISGIVGTGDPLRVVRAVPQVLAGRRVCLVGPRPYVPRDAPPRLVLTWPHAYLKVSEGCNSRCTYCLIPRLRGPLRSRPLDEVVAEARCLADAGIRELVITGQDTTAYGSDRADGTSLSVLIQHLGGLPVRWIRILYGHPGRISRRLLSVMAETPSVCRYLDLPVQHSHPRILAAMGRPAADPLRLFDRIRREIDGICLRTTVIVGFPGETDREFRALRRFVERAQVDRLGIFAYSAEEGTPAARMPDQVPERVRQERLAELAAIQAGVSRENLKNRVGRTYDLLVEGRSGRFLVGRTEYEAPGIDGVVRVRTERRIDPGTFIRVTITASDDHDLEGVVCAD